MKWALFFSVCTILCWGAYVPTLHQGQQGFGDKNSALRAFLFVGLAYSICAALVLAYIIFAKAEPLKFTSRGVSLSTFAGILGAIGASQLETYPLFLACGLIPWRWNAVATTRAGNAFLSNAGLLTATPINRDAVFLAEFSASSIQALMGIPVLLGFMLYYERAFTVNLLWLPVPLLVMGVLICGIGYALCGLTVLLRDTSNAYASLLRILWFLSPGLYSLDRVPEAYRQIYIYVNPFVGILEGIRRPIHDGLAPNWEALAASAVWALTVLFFGLSMINFAQQIFNFSFVSLISMNG